MCQNLGVSNIPTQKPALMNNIVRSVILAITALLLSSCAVEFAGGNSGPARGPVGPQPYPIVGGYNGGQWGGPQQYGQPQYGSIPPQYRTQQPAPRTVAQPYQAWLPPKNNYPWGGTQTAPMPAQGYTWETSPERARLAR